MKTFKSIFIHQRFFVYISLIACVFLVSYWFPVFYQISWILVLVFLVFVFYDFFILFRVKKGIAASRKLAEKFSNSDENLVEILVENKFPFAIAIRLIDELPIQFQQRDFFLEVNLQKKEKQILNYTIIPYERGAYTFGALNIYVSSKLGIFERRFKFDAKKEVAVYPSYIQMKKYEFLAMSNRLTEFGLKKIRRIGHTMEFEQIKNYVSGDDIRTINWKATAKKGELMVNQFQDEKSQPIYSIIDVSRTMKMPFEQLKLIDYAINSTLAFSNIALLKNDKAGLIVFSKKVDKIVAASNKKTNLNVLNEALYTVNTDFLDADFGYLNGIVKRKINQRSLLILYTNFEHKSSLQRQILYLKSIAKKHLLVVVFFENTELDSLINKDAEDLQTIYHKTIAQKFTFEKRLIVKELEKAGIYSILTKPKELSVNVINKYLEFKAKGLI